MTEDKRVTVRFNEAEQAELELLKANYKIEADGEALKLAVHWANHYLKNVTDTFFPPTHQVVLLKKTKTNETWRKVF